MVALPINALFAAGLFDSPWVVAAIVIGSALANWLSKRRQEKQARHQSEGNELAPSSSKPAGEFNLEETLRRLLGEEPLPPPVPPLIPRPAQRELSPAQTRSEKELLRPEPVQQPANPTTPVLRPPIVLPQASVRSHAASRQAEQAAQRFEQLNEQGRHPAMVISHTRPRPSRSSPRGTSRWRDARSLRRAFVASLIFAPPKSFEP